MGDEPFYIPNRSSTQRQPQAAEPLFTFQRGDDHYRCELRDHGMFGIEAQFFQNDESLSGRRFDASMSRTQTPRALAVQWAAEPRRERLSGSVVRGVLLLHRRPAARALPQKQGPWPE
jgi:hypothetical protein